MDIRSAIQAAPPNGTVEVSPGKYLATGIVIDKPLRLVGHDNPVLDGNQLGDVIKIQNTADVEVSGFVIQNSGKSYVEEFAGIKIENSERCSISNNQLQNNNYGIYLANTNFSTVSHNIVTGVFNTEADTGNGIHIWQGHDNRIEYNEVSGQRDGVYFEFVTDSSIENNKSYANLRYGLHFMFSHRDRYLNNVFSENGAGVAVMYSRDIEMVDNRFVKNQGAAAYGLLLKDIGGAKISGNHFVHNSIAVYMEGTNRGKFFRNVFEGNGWGLRVLGDCDANTFSDNDFVANTFDVSTNSESNPNNFYANYWSQYDGYDLNRDSWGDRPFRLVSLSSIIMERVDSSYSLLRSPLLMLLDSIERALPELIPARMEDAKPRMEPVQYSSQGSKELGT